MLEGDEKDYAEFKKLGREKHLKNRKFIYGFLVVVMLYGFSLAVHLEEEHSAGHHDIFFSIIMPLFFAVALVHHLVEKQHAVDLCSESWREEVEQLQGTIKQLQETIRQHESRGAPVSSPLAGSAPVG